MLEEDQAAGDRRGRIAGDRRPWPDSRSRQGRALMEATFYGVRGSIPAPGPETNRYGGNTSCVAVRTKGGALVILDMGTGAVQLGRKLMGAEFGQGKGTAAILISHAHWDHIQGFPFFPPIFVPGNRFTIYGPSRSSTMLENILEGQMNPHFSPLYTMKNLGATIEIAAVNLDEDEEFIESGLLVRGQLNPHGPTTALAYRLEEEIGGVQRSLVYASDAGYPASGPTDAVLALYHGADILIHDSTYTPEDRATRLSRGFSSVADAASSAVRAGVKHLVITHFDQDYSDDMVDAMAERCRRLLDEQGGRSIQLSAAREGLTLSV
ncbi:MAG: MBL fold metallo-hydrolase [Myxococcales bacterium]|nr:MBL fold metallo-hydrolase [Myxococcales bacterium]